MPAPRRLFDGAAQFFDGHGADVFLMLRQELPQPVEAGAVGVEIGAQDDDDSGRSACLAGGGG